MTTPTTTHRLPHSLAVTMAGASHVIMGVGAIVLYVMGKIDQTTFVAIMVGLGGVWAGVAGALKSAGIGQPVTQPAGSHPTPGVVATPAETPTVPAVGSD